MGFLKWLGGTTGAVTNWMQELPFEAERAFSGAVDGVFNIAGILQDAGKYAFREDFLDQMALHGSQRWAMAMQNFFGGASQEVNPDTGEVISTPSSGVGALFDMLPEPLVRESLRKNIGEKVLPFLDNVAEEVIRKPAATIALYEGLAYSETFKEANGDGLGAAAKALRMAYNLSEDISFGQAVSYSIGAGDILDAEQVAHVEALPEFQIASGLLDFGMQWFGDFDRLVPPLVKLHELSGARVPDMRLRNNATKVRETAYQNIVQLRAMRESLEHEVMTSTPEVAEALQRTAAGQKISDADWEIVSDHIGVQASAPRIKGDRTLVQTIDEIDGVAQDVESGFYGAIEAELSTLHEELKTLDADALQSLAVRRDNPTIEALTNDLVDGELHGLDEFADLGVIAEILADTEADVRLFEIDGLRRFFDEYRNRYPDSPNAARTTTLAQQLIRWQQAWSAGPAQITDAHALFFGVIAQKAGPRVFGEGADLHRVISPEPLAAQNSAVMGAQRAQRRGSDVINIAAPVVGDEFNLNTAAFGKGDPQTLFGRGDNLVLRIKGDEPISGIGIFEGGQREREVLVTGRYKITEVGTAGERPESMQLFFNNWSTGKGAAEAALHIGTDIKNAVIQSASVQFEYPSNLDATSLTLKLQNLEPGHVTSIGAIYPFTEWPTGGSHGIMLGVEKLEDGTFRLSSATIEQLDRTFGTSGYRYAEVTRVGDNTYINPDTIQEISDLATRRRALKDQITETARRTRETVKHTVSRSKDEALVEALRVLDEEAITLPGTPEQKWLRNVRGLLEERISRGDPISIEELQKLALPGSPLENGQVFRLTAAQHIAIERLRAIDPNTNSYHIPEVRDAAARLSQTTAPIIASLRALPKSGDPIYSMVIETIIGSLDGTLTHAAIMDAIEATDEGMLTLGRHVPEKSLQNRFALAEELGPILANKFFPKHERKYEIGRALALAPTKAARIDVMRILLGDTALIDDVDDLINTGSVIGSGQAMHQADNLLARQGPDPNTVPSDISFDDGDADLADLLGRVEAPDDRATQSIFREQTMGNALMGDLSLNEAMTQLGKENRLIVNEHVYAAEMLRDLSGTIVRVDNRPVLTGLGQGVRKYLEMVQTGVDHPIDFKQEWAAQAHQTYRNGHPLAKKSVHVIMSPFERVSRPIVSARDKSSVVESVRTMSIASGMPTKMADEWATRAAATISAGERVALVEEFHDAAMTHLASELGLDRVGINLTLSEMGLAVAGREVLGAQTHRAVRQVVEREVGTLLQNADVERLSGMMRRMDFPAERMREILEALNPETGIPLSQARKLFLNDIVDHMIYKSEFNWGPDQMNNWLRLAREGRRQATREYINARYAPDLEGKPGIDRVVRERYAELHHVEKSGEAAAPVLETQIQESIMVMNYAAMRRDIARLRQKGLIPMMDKKVMSVAAYNSTIDALDFFNRAIKTNLLLKPNWPIKTILLDEGLRPSVIFGLSALKYQARGANDLLVRANNAFNDVKWRNKNVVKGALGVLGVWAFGPPAAAAVGAGIGAKKAVRWNKERRLGEEVNPQKVTENVAKIADAGLDVAPVDAVMKSHLPSFHEGRGEELRQLLNHDREVLANVNDEGRNRTLSRDTRNWNTVTPDDPNYFPKMAAAINEHLKDSVIIHNIIAGKSIREIELWVQTSTEGRKIQKQLPIATADIPGWLEGIVQVTKELFGPMPEELVQKIGKGKRVTPDELRIALRSVEDRKQLPVFNGPEIQHWISGDRYTDDVASIIDRVVHGLVEVPSDELVRNPLLQLFYKQEFGRILDLRNRLGRYEEAGGVSAKELQDIAVHAREYAFNQTKKYVYEFAARNDFHRIVRFIAPFAPAAQEAITTWAKLAVNEPYRFTRLIKVYQDLTELPFVEEEVELDDEGNPLRVERYAVVTMPEAMKTFLRPGTLLGDYFNYNSPDGNQLKFPLSNLNMIFQGDFFSGPPVRFVASAAVKWKPELEDVLKWAIPYGASDRWYDNFVGSFPANIAQAITSDFDKDRHARTTFNIARMYLTEYYLGYRDYGGDIATDEAAFRKFEAEVENAANDYYNLQVLATFVSPTPILQSSPYKFYIDAYAQMQKDDPENALANFIDSYGDEFRALTAYTTRSNAGIQSTMGAHQLYQQHKDLIRQYPQLGSFITGFSEANDDMTKFSHAAYQFQLGENLVAGTDINLREIRDIRDAMTDPDVSVGWMKYINSMELIDAERTRRGLTSLNVKGAKDLADYKKGMVQFLAQEYPAWYAAYNNTDRLRSQNLIEGFNAILADSKLAGRPDVEALRQWKFLYDGAVTAIYDSDGPKSLDAQGNAAIKDWYDRNVNALLDTNLSFGPIFYRYLDNIQIGVQ